MKGPTMRRSAKGSTRPTSNPPRSLRRCLITSSSMTATSEYQLVRGFTSAAAPSVARALSQSHRGSILCKRHRCRFLDDAQRDGRAHGLHARNSRKMVEKKCLVRLGIPRHYAQQEVPLAEQRVAFQHFGVIAYCPLEFGERLAPVARELHVHEHHEIEPELFTVEQRDA